MTLINILKSRWLPWLLAICFLLLGILASRTRTAVQRTNEHLERQIQTLTFEVAQTEWALKQEQERQRATKKTREERKPDGTVIVEREETEETLSTKTESSGSSLTETKKEQSEEVVVQRVTDNKNNRWGLDVGIHRQLLGPGARQNRLSMGYELDYRLAPVLDIHFPDTFNTLSGVGIGIEVRL